jgi:hypothetical protein
MADVKIGDPAPLGFAGLGVTLLLLSTANAGLWNHSGGAAAVGTALVFGAIGLGIVGILEFLRGNTFTGTLFGAFATFWGSAYYWLTHPALQQAKGSLGVLLLVYGAAALILWIVSIKHSIHYNLLLLLLVVTLISLAIGNWNNGHSGAIKFGGWIGILTSLVAFYITAKSLINESYGKKVLP